VIGILDYGMGNLSSVFNSLEYLGFETKIVRNLDEIEGLTHLIVPGVGSFSKAMNNLEERDLIPAIINHIDSGKPYLGICLGMQLLATMGYEGQKSKGLGLIEGEIIPFEANIQVPHVGWNNINCSRNHPLINNNANHIDFYFVHSYHFDVKNKGDILTVTDYEITFTSIVGKNNIIGVQFHPEKSQDPGLKFLESFCEWDGQC